MPSSNAEAAHPANLCIGSGIAHRGPPLAFSDRHDTLIIILCLCVSHARYLTVLGMLFSFLTYSLILIISWSKKER